MDTKRVKKKEQKRLDVLLVERGLSPSRERAQGSILAGEVWSGERRLEKVGEKHPQDIILEIRSRIPAYSSRGGLKLAHALDLFSLCVEGKVCIDIGASTGGFTDCLLSRGAMKVFAIDVGYGQLDQKLRNDPRVVNVEKTNARYLTPEGLISVSQAPASQVSAISFAVVDVSFISLRTVLPPLGDAFRQVRDWVLLFKPQFEVGPQNLRKGGIVKSDDIAREALESLQSELASLGWLLRHGPESSPLAGKKSGNLEYLIHYELLPHP